MAKIIKAAEKTDSYLYKISSSLLKLMMAQATEDQENPTHYVSLLCFSGFCGHFFDRHMDSFKRDDPVFGVGSYGQISQLVPKHLFIFFEQLDEMNDDGWKILQHLKARKEGEGTTSDSSLNRGRQIPHRGENCH